MDAERKRKPSCWTCRIRHKKCDGALPVCGGCSALQINCHHGASKPIWMDGGERQKQMTRQIKSQVKQSAKRRRDIALMQSLAENLSNTPPHDSAVCDLKGQSTEPLHAKSKQDGQRLGADHNALWSSVGHSQPLGASSTQSSDWNVPTWSSQSETEMGFVTAYIDYVFPGLFPFYRPGILEGGRSWLLTLATSNRAFYSIVVSISTYFFSVVPIHLRPEYPNCTTVTWNALQKQAEASLSTVQLDLATLNKRGVGNYLAESVCLLVNVVQYLGFEISIRSGKWQIHLDAATSLLEQIINTHGNCNGQRSIRTVLDKLHHLGTPMPAEYILNSIQGAFRFFSVILLINDIISSSSLERTPRLKAYHSELQNDGSQEGVALRTEEILGCHAWVLLILSDISTLNAEKKDLQGGLKKRWVRSQASLIESRIQHGLEQLNQPSSSSQPARDLEQFLRYPCCGGGLEEGIKDVTRIWASSVHIYLLVVMIGWQPSDSRIRSNTKVVLDLLCRISSPFWVRSLAWPLCVSGCLALDEERQTFGKIRHSLQAIQLYGTLREAFSIVDCAWAKSKFDLESWDIPACLGSLGYRVLLI